MRVRLTDGTREVEITTPSRTPLPQIEDTARRLYALTSPNPEQDSTAGFGFGRDLDGVSLDSNTERAEPYDNGRDTDEDEQ